jgi:hypothetical protein
MSFESSPAEDAIASYLAGRIKAERLVIAVAAEYYRNAGRGRRHTLQPLIDIIDRASPGIVELETAQGGSGFEIRLAERPFPEDAEADLRRAAEACLASHRTTGLLATPPANASHPGMLARIVGAIRRLFTASG